MNCNHNKRRINRDTIRLSIAIPGSYDHKPAQVWRIRHQDGNHDFCLEGIILDDPKTRSRSAVTHVREGDVVMITFTASAGIQPSPAGFRVNTKGIPEPFEDLFQLSKNQTISAGPLIDFDGRAFLHFGVEDLCAFMRARHPRWLQNQVDATLRTWRKEAPDIYVRVAPAHWLGKKPWLLASLDPRRALEDHHRQLGDDLRRFCIRRLVPNKNKCLNRSLPYALKSENHYQNASYLLEYHLAEMDDAQIRICAFKNPKAALARYQRASEPRHRALLLSCAFRHAWPDRVLMRDPAFHRDVVESLIEYSDEWILSNPDGLVGVLRMISARIPFHPSPRDLARMLKSVDPQTKKQVAAFITSRI